jgi:hypothetical protein
MMMIRHHGHYQEVSESIVPWFMIWKAEKKKICSTNATRGVRVGRNKYECPIPVVVFVVVAAVDADDEAKTHTVTVLMLFLKQQE